ncbi:MAG: phytoene desaturase family protein, partial [Gaiellaceae bacterium]
NFKRAVLDRQVLTPLDLERVFSLSGGNIFQGAMTPGQLFAFRPVPGYARYRTPLDGLYLCGAAAHPGGGVMGTPGLNAAREILGRRRLDGRGGGRRARSRGSTSGRETPT